MKPVNVKKLILPNIPYVFIALLATKVSEAVRLAPGSDASAKLLNIMTGLNTAFHSLVPSFHPIDLCVGVAAAIAIRLAVYIKGKNAKKFRKNLEYGSARWGTAEDIKPYVDPAFENNIILFRTYLLAFHSFPPCFLQKRTLCRRNNLLTNTYRYASRYFQNNTDSPFQLIQV